MRCHRAAPGEFEQERLLAGVQAERGQQLRCPGAVTQAQQADGLPTVLMTYRGVKTGKVRKTPVMRGASGGRTHMSPAVFSCAARLLAMSGQVQPAADAGALHPGGE